MLTEYNANQTEAAPDSAGEEQFMPTSAGIETPSIVALRQALLVRVAEYFLPEGLTPEFIEAWTHEMVADIETDLGRFRDGQRKYKNNFLDKDMIPNLDQELRDASHYMRGWRMQKKFIAMTIR